MSPGLSVATYYAILKEHVRAGEMDRFAATLDSMWRRYPHEVERFAERLAGMGEKNE